MMADKPKSATQKAASVPKGVRQSKNSLPESSNRVERTKQSIPEGTETPTTEVLEAEKVNITKKLPPEVAILHIFENGKNKYSIWGSHVDKDKKLPQTVAEEKPDFSIGTPINNRVDATNLKNSMRDFSDLQSPLRKWVMRLRKNIGEKLCLVIVDYTNFEIPWEMLELRPDQHQAPPENLGALITTVRWRKVNNDNVDCDEPYVELQLETDECCGKTVAYVDQELVKQNHQTSEEIESLKKLQATIYDSIKDFHTHLHCNSAAHSFVYICTHGFFGKSREEIAIGSEKNNEERLKLNDFMKRPLNPRRKSQGIVFMNTCHSARELTDPVLRHTYRKNFIEVFLRQGARGVIGTLGAVNTNVASQFACELIKKSLSSSELSVASILRQLRSKAVENLHPDEPDDMQLLSYINAFMYVYYGNPMTILRLTEQGQ